MCPASNIRRIYAKIVQTSGNKKESAKRFAISCPSTVHPHKKPTNQSCDRQTSEIVTRHHTNLSPPHLPTYHPNSDKLPYRTHCNITFINSVKDHENAQHSIPMQKTAFRHKQTSKKTSVPPVPSQHPMERRQQALLSSIHGMLSLVQGLFSAYFQPTLQHMSDIYTHLFHFINE